MNREGWLSYQPMIKNTYVNIPIKSLQAYGKIWISLQGTIFTYRKKFRDEDHTIEFPIELLSVSYKKKFDWMRLIWAIVSIILVPGLFFLCCSIFYYYFGNPLNLSSNLIYGTGFFMGFSVSLYLIGSFFRRVPVVILTSEEGYHIEISLEGKHKKLLNDLFSEFEKRKAEVLEKEAYLLQFAKSNLIIKPLSRIIGQIILFAIPWMLLHVDSLFILILIPIIWHGYKYLLYFTRPKLHRQYYVFYEKEKYSEALEFLRQLLIEKPDYIKAYQDYIHILCLKGHFDEALTFISNLGEDIDREFCQAAQDHILWSKQFWKRKFGEETIK